jgi:hypothetical protein
VSRFWNDALEILDTASRAPQAGSATNLAVVVERSGGLRIVAAEGWSAEGLQSHFGAAAVYQVTHTPRAVRVEGRGPGMSCTLRSPAGRPWACPTAPVTSLPPHPSR